jgi:cell division protein FtsL
MLPQGAPPRRHESQRELSVVRRQARTRVRRRRAIALLMAFGVLAGGLLFSVVVAHVAITQNQFRLERLEARALDEQAQYERLRLQVAEMESPGRVVAEAQQRLGMVQPHEVTYLSPDPTPTFAAARRDPEPQPSGGVAAATNPASGWQVVKPHLAER